MGALGSLVGGVASAIFDAAGRWVAAGAVWLLDQVGRALSATTSIDLGAAWFTSHEAVMASLGAAVVLPMLCCTAIVAVFRQDLGQLVRSFLVKLPLAMLFTGLCVVLVRLAMTVTDDLSGRVLRAGGVDAGHVLTPLASFLAAAALPSSGGVPAFVVFVAAVLVALASFALWLELVVRSAAIAAATLFLPLALAGLVWPSVSHWCRRLADTIAALVLSKLVVAAVLSLAAGAVASAVTGTSGDASGGFATAVTGIALLIVATTAPFVLLRLVPAVEAGAVLHLEQMRHRLQRTATAPVRMVSVAAQLAGSAGMLGAAGAVETPASAAGGSAGSIGLLTGDPRGWGPFTAGASEVLVRATPAATPPTTSAATPGAAPSSDDQRGNSARQPGVGEDSP